MTITRRARRAADTLAEQAVAQQKDLYRTRIERIQQAVSPPLSNSELSLALDLNAPPEGQTGASAVGRFVSTSPRLRRARPDTFTRAVIDALLGGQLLLAVHPPREPGARREVLVCEPGEVGLLARTYDILNLGGGPTPRAGELHGREEDPEEDAWDLFGSAFHRLQQNETSPVERTFQPAGQSGPQQRWPAPGQPWPARSLAGRLLPPIGLGAMRLSTAGRPEPEDAEAVVIDALERGLRLIDSADVYCLDEPDLGHNERLIARALKRWGGPREEVLVATKGGLSRPGGRWLPDGRPQRLKAAVERSLRALEVDAIDLYQLHVIDRRVGLEESFGALARLKEKGLIRHLGLCNVKAAELDRARAIAPVDCVQIELNWFSPARARDGLLSRCQELGIPVIAHSPTGGYRSTARLLNHDLIGRIARLREVSPQQVLLAWLLQLAPGLLLIPGATRLASVSGSAAALDFQLEEGDLRQLEARATWAGPLRERLWGQALPFGATPVDDPSPALEPSPAPEPHAAAAEPPPAEPPPAPPQKAAPPQPVIPRPAPPGTDEVVLLMGAQASGKTSSVTPFLEAGYARLNRDELGGSMARLADRLNELLAEGQRRVILDNTFPDPESRAPFIGAARARGIKVRGLWIDIRREDALVNAAGRVLERSGKLPSPAEISRAGRKDPNILPPAALYQFWRRWTPPDTSEGFSTLQRIPFVRRPQPDHQGRALLLDMDGTVRRTRSGAPFPRTPDDVELLPHRAEILRRYHDEGWLLLGVSNQSAVARGLSAEAVEACFERTRSLLGLPLEIHYCPHPAGRIRCWCRKPMPGMGVMLIRQHQLDPAQCLMVGDQPSDEEFAGTLGIRYIDADEFFVAPT